MNLLQAHGDMDIYFCIETHIDYEIPYDAEVRDIESLLKKRLDRLEYAPYSVSRGLEKNVIANVKALSRIFSHYYDEPPFEELLPVLICAAVKTETITDTFASIRAHMGNAWVDLSKLNSGVQAFLRKYYDHLT